MSDQDKSFSLQDQADEWWEKKKNITLGIISWSNSKFSEVTS